MTQEEKDAQVQKLLAIVAKQKADIQKAERPKWETNCSFAFTEDGSLRVNLQTVLDPDAVVNMYAFLLQKADSYARAAMELNHSGEFKWMDYTLNQWASDFKTRINKIQLTKMKAKLEESEKALDKLVSKEKREEMELERLTKELGA